ncbi:MAG: ABC transporter ATP-binding protein [Lentisphaeraceae bacterium]|nr:ABC transporter ATP-binding protein [Lentisphaeraceae bacterium]
MDEQRGEALLTIEGLSITFRTPGGEVTPVPEVSLQVRSGERVALVGESGCGKSITALSVTALPPTDRALRRGSIRFAGQELVGNAQTLSKVRRGGIAYVFQDPMASLNPVMTIGAQMAEALPPLLRRERRARIVDLLADVGLPDPARAAEAYPCELSGGQCQRVMLAMALAAEPQLLIADEPTTALDVTTQRLILGLMVELAAKRQMALLLITHNLGIVANYMERLYVMYAGRIVESGPVREVIASPRHPYTRGLIAAVPSLRLDEPRLQDIPGTVPPAGRFPPGCAFAPRCPLATEACSAAVPPLRLDGERAVRCVVG